MTDETPPAPISIVNRLTMEDLRLAHEILSQVFADDPEPVPDWDRGNPDSLATCRGCIEVEAFGVRKYPDLASAAAKLFYSTIKLHCFPNGNKRFALVLTLLLIAKNGHRLDAPQGVGARVAKLVADSDPHHPRSKPDVLIETLSKFYARHIVPQAPLND